MHYIHYRSSVVEQSQSRCSEKFVCLEFIGAFIAAALVFGTYYDAINRFDGGVRQVDRRE